jgi:hypothetical protein
LSVFLAFNLDHLEFFLFIKNEVNSEQGLSLITSNRQAYLLGSTIHYNYYKIEKPNCMDNLFAIEIQSAGMQVLESCYIIATSKNIDTIISRYDFLQERIKILKQGQK